jgi:hypothetical protein
MKLIAPDSPGSEKIYRHWLFILRYLATPIVVIAPLLQVISLF